jgi:rRNA maturation RNase YbeY
MAITYITDYGSLPRQFKKRQTSLWIKAIVQKHGKKTGDIAYIFCNDEKILEINTQYLNHHYFTDIITFDYTEGNVVSGDIFISLETVKTNSERYKTNYEEELRRVIIHGVLHLCGYEDKTRKDKKNMREKEDEALGLFETALRNEI